MAAGSIAGNGLKTGGVEIKTQWPQVTEVVDVTVDAADDIYLMTRSGPPIIKLNALGHVLDAFGEDIFVRPHGIYRKADGTLFGVDDRGHAVYRFDKYNHLVQTLGTRCVPSDTGCTDHKYQHVTHGGPPFNAPTRLTVDKNENLYVTDGYGNARVHKFTPNGELIQSWGQPGTEPGQFNLPHGLAIDSSDRLYVADRQNHRLQVFSLEGELLNVWTGFYRPSAVWIVDDILYVAECMRTSVFNAVPSRVTALNTDGHFLSVLGRELPYDAEYGSRCAHGVAVDSKGNLYVAEVGKKLSENFLGIKKYERV